MRIALACDHGAFELKNHLLTWLPSHDGAVQTVNLGVDGPQSVDYPLMAEKLCRMVLSREVARGILLCGTGLGISIAANRFSGIRAALCHDEYTARLSRLHNDANVLVLGGRTTGTATAEGIVATWLATPFEGGRHQRRIDMIDHIRE